MNQNRCRVATLLESTMESQQPNPPLLSDDLHEIGTRVVDMLNQVSFLYRFPTLAGVTLACIAQHVEPMKQLLQQCGDVRRRLAEAKPTTFPLTHVNASDPLDAGYQYACAGMSAFVAALARTIGSATDSGDAGADRATTVAMLDRCAAGKVSPDPKGFLDAKDIIDAHGESAAQRAGETFTVMSDLQWQKFRIVIFYFLLDMQKLSERD